MKTKYIACLGPAVSPEAALPVATVSFGLHCLPQPPPCRRSPEGRPQTTMVFAQNTHFWLTKNTSFSGKGVWTLDLWGAIKARDGMCWEAAACFSTLKETSWTQVLLCLLLSGPQLIRSEREDFIPMSPDKQLFQQAPWEARRCAGSLAGTTIFFPSSWCKHLPALTLRHILTTTGVSLSVYLLPLSLQIAKCFQRTLSPHSIDKADLWVLTLKMPSLLLCYFIQSRGSPGNVKLRPEPHVTCRPEYKQTSFSI